MITQINTLVQSLISFSPALSLLTIFLNSYFCLLLSSFFSSLLARSFTLSPATSKLFLNQKEKIIHRRPSSLHCVICESCFWQFSIILVVQVLKSQTSTRTVSSWQGVVKVPYVTIQYDVKLARTWSRSRRKTRGRSLTSSRAWRLITTPMGLELGSDPSYDERTFETNRKYIFFRRFYGNRCIRGTTAIGDI